MGWIPVSDGAGGDGATILHAAEPQSDGTLRFRYGVDSSGRPTYTAAGTADTPALVILDEDGRFKAREVSY